MSKANKAKTGQKPDASKRSFLNKLWLGLGILALMEFAGLVVAYLRPSKTRARPGEFGTLMEVGAVDQFPVNSVTAFVRGKFYLCRLEDGGYLAISRKCTHLGCSVPWVDNEKRFACPCHASAFDIRGEVISPPAPRALDIYRLFIENNILKVDTGKPIKRSGFRKEQVTYLKKRG
jgi:nitrite reductase/ring-hydroxylating ferredoxin subunit